MKKRRLISLTAVFMLVFTLISFLPKGVLNAGAITENPCNKQDNKEVPYDGSNWVQPESWDCPAIDPREYQGGIMIYFDRIGLEPNYAKGKVQRVYVSIVGATEPVSMMKFHIFYDTRLTVKKNSSDEFLTTGKVLKDFTTGSAMVEEGQLAFYAYSNKDIQLNDSNLFTVDFIVPENAELGDVYPIGISYVDDGIVADTFIDADHDDAGKLQMTYVFKKGIYNGYIKVIDIDYSYPPDSSEAEDSSSRPDNSSSQPDKPEYELGDVNGDGTVDIEDAVQVLGHVNGQKALTDDEVSRADIDSNTEIDIEDAVAIIAHVNGMKSIG